MNEIEMWKKIDALAQQVTRIADALEKVVRCIPPNSYPDGSTVIQTLPCDTHPEEPK